MLVCFALFLGSALAGNHVNATLVPGITGAQVKAAASAIAVATFDHKGKTAEVLCMGADATLSCEIQNQADHSVIAASSTLQFCHFGDNFALMSDKLSDRWILIPHAALNRSGTMECKG